MELQNLKFSGHESFHCRPFWLKKGFDYVKNDFSFNEKSGIDLGVGRNMVGSIRFWLKAFDIINDNDQLTQLAIQLFEEDGWDPFLEDEATLWLLHYRLSSKKYSTIYNLVFSELRKVRPEFSKNHFLSHVNEIDKKQSDNIVGKDFGVFIKTYFAKPSQDKEESFSGLLAELELLKEVGDDQQKNTLYHIRNSKQDNIPWQIVLFVILDNNNYSNSVSVKSLLIDSDGVGNLFVFTQEGLENKLIEISENVSGIVYKNDAGVKELQFKSVKPNKFNILEKYYAKK